MARVTKLELEQLLSQRNAELQLARHRISVLEAELALRPRAPAPTPNAPIQVRVGGVLCNVINERHGQATRKRYVPVAAQQ